MKNGAGVNQVDDSAGSPDQPPETGDGDIGMIAAVDNQRYSSNRARLRVHGRDKAFLLDTGASANLISTHDLDINQLQLTTPGRVFTMWNGTVQRSAGSAVIRVYNPKTKQSHDLKFDIVSERLTPILGNTAVQSMGLITMETGLYESVAAVTTPKVKEGYMRAYPQVFDPPVGTLEGEIDLQVEQSVQPTVLPARQVPVALRQPFKEELVRLQKLQVIEPVSSPTDWVSQAVVIHKKNGSVRVCIDPRPLNYALKRKRYHLPTFDEVLPELADAKVFSKLDL